MEGSGENRVFGWRRTRARLLVAVTLAVITIAPRALAEPHSAPVQVLSVRPYTTGNTAGDAAFIATTNPGICGATGNTGFWISLADASGQGMLSTAITALSTGARVTVEISNTTGCTPTNGGVVQLQSLTLLASGYPGPY